MLKILGQTIQKWHVFRTFSSLQVLHALLSSFKKTGSTVWLDFAGAGEYYCICENSLCLRRELCEIWWTASSIGSRLRHRMELKTKSLNVKNIFRCGVRHKWACQTNSCITHPELHPNYWWLSCILENVGSRFLKKNAWNKNSDWYYWFLLFSF